MPVVRNVPITAVENHQSGEERFISWFVLRYSFSLYLSFVAQSDLVYAMDCDVSKHFLNAPITADCFCCQLGFLLLSSCFVKLVISNRVNCVKH